MSMFFKKVEYTCFNTSRVIESFLPELMHYQTNRLVEVTSNIWATKFQMTGVSSCLPSCLGQVIYKTSLLRLQPRQMTVSIAEVSPSRHTLSRDPNFSPAPVSDDEDSSLCKWLSNMKKTREGRGLYWFTHC